jgi:hypothetical protein
LLGSWAGIDPWSSWQLDFGPASQALLTGAECALPAIATMGEWVAVLKCFTAHEHYGARSEDHLPSMLFFACKMGDVQLIPAVPLHAGLLLAVPTGLAPEPTRKELKVRAWLDPTWPDLT